MILVTQQIVAPAVLVCSIIILHQQQQSFAEITFLQSPQTVALVHGGSATFTCIVSAETISYLVNETVADDQNISLKGFIQSDVDTVSEGIKSRTLSAPALIPYNNTNITCFGINFSPIMINESDLAILLVQGPLSSVGDLSYSFIDSSTVKISWSPPFTLPGTDITGYNISATSNGTTTNYFTSNSYYELSLTDITDSPCIEIVITVSGYNGLDGENTTLTGIYLFEVPVGHQMTVRATIHAINGVIESLILNVSGICYGQYPTHINLTIQYSNNGSLLTTIDDIPLVLTNDTDILTTTNDTIILLPVDNNYTAIITFSNLNGQINFNSTVVFDTNVIHGVQDVIVSDAIAPTIVLVCVFSYNNTVPVVVPVVPVVGCLIELVLIENDNIRFTSTGNRTDNDEAVVTIVTVLPGSYSVRVYDINSNNDQSSITAYKINELIILPQPSSTITIPVIMTTSYNGTGMISNRYFSTSEQLTLSTMKSILISVSPSISSSDTSVNSTTSTTTTITVIVVTVGCIVVMILMIIISCILVLLYRKYKGSKYTPNNNNSNVSNVVPVVPNPSYQDPRDIISQRNKNSIIIDANPSYSHVSINRR